MKRCYKKGSVVLVKYPYTNYLTWKIRPALILRDQAIDGDLLCLRITSVPTQQSFEVSDFDQQELVTVFPKTSFVRYDKLFTLSSELVIKDLGSFSSGFVTKLLNAFIYYLSH